ncbi:acyl-CoA dehydrogenase family protein [Haladaptatus sp. T7]|uniref:acyl-CoA dehydrogenase family protein n=1 Tax=Haladaptatus sp. T7 TaxID=2029368 RepID=UPI0021A2596A|nr:acyl-CoA dehydrogenase family protein [Haladaptatus sp. T7]GKZ14337.1 DNA alkylation response protein [Haladaptatus sp. T7]
MSIDYGRFDRGRGMNYWQYDPVLQHEVERTYPGDRGWAEERFDEFGAIVGTTVAPNSDTIDEHGPELRRYDRHGRLVNDIEYHPAQLENEELVYGAGIVADSFRAPPDRDDPASMLHHLTMDYLLAYADVGLTCPVAMTAGVALVLERFDHGSDGSLSEFFDRLTAREYDDLLQGAMFLTERQGGSDVGATETVAERTDDGWELTGEKWFCSNVDSGAILTLARTPDAPDGTEGLSLFLVPGTTSNGERDGTFVRRLKDKLGTVSVPTGEVEFRGAEAHLVGELESGFRYMSEMLNLERIANAFASCGLIGRALLESKVRAANREAFGSTIDRYPLMRRDLVEMAVAHEAATAFTFDAGRAFDRYHRGDEDAFALMRLLVPIAKSRTGRMAVDVASYAMEIHGGNGYVNDFVTNRLLRDAQVLPIWEGTSNILSLDVLRALAREDAHEPALALTRDRLDGIEHDDLADLVATTRDELDGLQEALVTLATEEEEYAQLHAKELAEYVFDVYTAALLLSEADGELAAGNRRKGLVARQFVTDAFGRSAARGISSGDTLSLDGFEEIVRFA